MVSGLSACTPDTTITAGYAVNPRQCVSQTNGPCSVLVRMIHDKNRLMPTLESFDALQTACPTMVENIQKECGLSGYALSARVMQFFIQIVEKKFLTWKENPGDVFYVDLGQEEEDALRSQLSNATSGFPPLLPS